MDAACEARDGSRVCFPDPDSVRVLLGLYRANDMHNAYNASHTKNATNTTNMLNTISILRVLLILAITLMTRIPVLVMLPFGYWSLHSFALESFQSDDEPGDIPSPSVQIFN